MAGFGKRKDGQSYPKRNKSSINKRGTTSASGIKTNKRIIQLKTIPSFSDRYKSNWILVTKEGNLKFGHDYDRMMDVIGRRLDDNEPIQILRDGFENSFDRTDEWHAEKRKQS